MQFEQLIRQCSFHFNCLETFDDVAFLDVIIAIKTNTAFVAGINFADVVLAALER